MASGSGPFRIQSPRPRHRTSPYPSNPPTHGQNSLIGRGSPPTQVAPTSANTPLQGKLNKLRTVLRGVKTGLSGIPPVQLAVGGLEECLAHMRIGEETRYEYDEILSDLTNLANLLQIHAVGKNPWDVPYSIASVAGIIEEQASVIKDCQDRSQITRLAMAQDDVETVLKCYRRIGALFQQLQVEISLSTWDKVQEEQMDTRLKDLLPAHEAFYNAALPTTAMKRGGCTKNTRVKLLDEAWDWTRDECGAKVYWLNGMAGTGKTTIAYTICEMLEGNERLGASFFCSRNSPDCRNVNKVVPTIAYHLGLYSESYRRALCDVLKHNPDAATRDISTQFEILIVRVLAKISKGMPTSVVVVIDALDECSDVSGTRQTLDLLFRHGSQLPLKFFITSRPEPAIVKQITLQGPPLRLIIHLHDIEQSLVQADIRTYLIEALSPLKPPSTSIELLTAHAGRLFIFAATMVRYISPDDDSVDHEERLSVMLDITSEAGSQVEGYEDLDELYSIILTKALEESRANRSETEMRYRVLRTVVCARETLSTSALAELLGMKDRKKVEIAIKPLESVLYFSPITGVVSTLHASFPDFLLNAKRSERFYCNQIEHSAFLATRSFNVMRQSLRFNICELESSYLPDKDVPDLQSRVQNAISPGLFYTCQYWSDHLTIATASRDLCSLLEDFLTHRLLFWMEVLSLKQCVDRGEGILGQVLSWLPADAAKLSDFAYDARNFVTTFAANPTSRSTPHIYMSTLPFMSKQSLVWRTHWPRTQSLMQVEGAAMEARWRPMLATWNNGRRVNSITQSSDGKRIASGSGGNEVSIWDASSGARIVGPLEGHEESVWSVAFSPDNTRIASGSVDHTIRIWDARNGSLIAGPLLGHTADVNSVAFSPDGTRLASGSDDHTIRMWNAHTGASVGDAYKGHQDKVWSVVFSPNGEHLASGSEDRSIRVWDSRTGIAALGPMESHTRPVKTIAYSSNGLLLASGSEDCTVRVWDMSNGVMLVGPFEGHSRTVSSVWFSPNDTWVVSGSYDRAVRVWEATSGNLVAGPFEGHSGDVNAVLFTPDGTRILSSSDDGTIRVWDTRHGTTGATESSGHTGSINSVALSPDGTRVASGSSDKTICVWDTHNGALVASPLTGHIGEVKSVAFSPDGARIVSGSSDRTLRTWNASTGTLLVGPIEGHTGSVRAVALSPNGSQIASGSGDATIRLWDSHAGTSSIAKPFEGHTSTVASIAFSPDSARLVSGSWDDTVRMWDAKGGITLWTSSAHTDDVNCVAFSLDGTWVVSGSDDRTVLVLDAADGAVLHGPFTGHTDIVWSVAFSPDGTRVVSGSSDQTVRVWDMESGTMVVGPLRGHTAAVRSVAFSFAGTRIVSGSDDRTIRFWDITAATSPNATSFHRLDIGADGWLTNSESQLLLWVPPHLRLSFKVPSLSSSLVIGDGYTIRGDHTALLLGERWKECYNVS